MTIKKGLTYSEQRARDAKSNQICPVEGCRERLGRNYLHGVCFLHDNDMEHSTSPAAQKRRDEAKRAKRREELGLKVVNVRESIPELRGTAKRAVTMKKTPWDD